jgi:hypothetical protein
LQRSPPRESCCGSFCHYCYLILNYSSVSNQI